MSEDVTPSSDMAPADWTDIAESEFEDFVISPKTIGFVFNHPDIGLHGFTYDRVEGHIQPNSFEVADDE